MARCNNCKTQLGCSCKKRTASNGASVCANCITSYERSIKGGSSSGTILNVTAEPKQ